MIPMHSVMHLLWEVSGQNNRDEDSHIAKWMVEELQRPCLWFCLGMSPYM